MAKVGIALWGGMDPTKLVDCVKLAEKHNFPAWMAEGHGGDAFSILTACAIATSKIRLGTSIVSVFVRSAPTIALGAAMVDAFSHGRFVLGLGSSHRVQVEPEHGLPYEEPLQRTRESVQIIRELLSNGKAEFSGKIFPRVTYDFWFTNPRKPIPIYLAAINPKMLELCGQLADGTLMVWTTVGRARYAAKILEEAARRNGRNKALEVGALIPTCVADDEEAALDGARKLVGLYAGFYPRYNKIVAESGFNKKAAAIRKAWVDGNKEEAFALVDEKMARTFCITGGKEDCQKRLIEYRKVGVTLPILFPFAPSAKKGRTWGFGGQASVEVATQSAIEAGSG
jgi:alkanesulfonate monooxygenase SsuD/methylene tetrahydromethanopterin reductase-like flavin-dependent oxidoreductase (luciferase family)